MCLAQEHNAVTTVKLELATPQSRLKQSTTEPLRLSNIHYYLKRRPIDNVNNLIQYIKWSSVVFFIHIWEGLLPNIRWEILL